MCMRKAVLYYSKGKIFEFKLLLLGCLEGKKEKGKDIETYHLTMKDELVNTTAKLVQKTFKLLQ